MEKKYKHKKSGLVVKLVQNDANYTEYYKVHGVFSNSEIPAFVVENSNDWELIEDKPAFKLITQDGVTINNPNATVHIVYQGKDEWFYEFSSAYAYKECHKSAYDYTDIAFSTREHADKYLKKMNKPKVILTTQDGIDMTDPYQKTYGVNIPSWNRWEGTAATSFGPTDGFLVFSSEAKRDEYILYNKPLLTVGDVVRAEGKIHDSCNFSNGNRDVIKREFNKLRELAKSKM